jgi:hypothetical protein
MFPARALEAITPETITKAVDLYEIIKQLRLRLSHISEESLDRALETHLQGVLEKLEKRIEKLTENNTRNVEIIMARHGLYDAAFQQMILLCQHISPALSDVMKEMRNIHSEFFSELQQVSNQYVQMIEDEKKKSEQLQEKLNQMEDECNQLLEATKLLDKVIHELYSDHSPHLCLRKLKKITKLFLIFDTNSAKPSRNKVPVE